MWYEIVLSARFTRLRSAVIPGDFESHYIVTKLLLWKKHAVGISCEKHWILWQGITFVGDWDIRQFHLAWHVISYKGGFLNISADRPWMRSSIRSFYVPNIKDIFMDFFSQHYLAVCCRRILKTLRQIYWINVIGAIYKTLQWNCYRLIQSWLVMKMHFDGQTAFLLLFSVS